MSYHPFSISEGDTLLPPKDRSLAVSVGGGCLHRLCRSAVSEGRVACKVPCQDVAGCLEFRSDESHPDQPGAHRKFRVLDLWLFRAGLAGKFRLCGKREAKLDVTLQFPGMQAAEPSVSFVRELEEAELDRALRKGRVQVKHMVARIVVMVVPTCVGVIAVVPDVCELAHALGLFPVQEGEKILIDRPAVMVDPCPVKPQGADQEVLVACHQVCEVTEGLSGMPIRSDVDVDSAHVLRIALGFAMPQLSDQLLQAFDVLVGEDRGDQLAFFIVLGGHDAAVSLEFPLPILLIPSAPGLVSVSVGCVFKPSCSEVGGGNLSCIPAADSVHLDLNSDGLIFHGFDLDSGGFFHGGVLLPACVFFPFGTVLITLKSTFIQLILTCKMHKDFAVNCALFGLFFSF